MCCHRPKCQAPTLWRHFGQRLRWGHALQQRLAGNYCAPAALSTAAWQLLASTTAPTVMDSAVPSLPRTRFTVR